MFQSPRVNLPSTHTQDQEPSLCLRRSCEMYSLRFATGVPFGALSSASQAATQFREPGEGHARNAGHKVRLGLAVPRTTWVVGSAREGAGPGPGPTPRWGGRGVRGRGVRGRAPSPREDSRALRGVGTSRPSQVCPVRCVFLWGLSSLPASRTRRGIITGVFCALVGGGRVGPWLG